MKDRLIQWVLPVDNNFKQTSILNMEDFENFFFHCEKKLFYGPFSRRETPCSTFILQKPALFPKLSKHRNSRSTSSSNWSMARNEWHSRSRDYKFALFLKLIVVPSIRYRYINNAFLFVYVKRSSSPSNFRKNDTKVIKRKFKRS